MAKGLARIFCVTLAAACFAASPAGAATTIGQLDPAAAPSGSCLGSSSWVQDSTLAVSYAVPAGNWVVTSWSHKANAASGKQIGLRVWRPTATPGTYTRAAGESLETLTPSAVNSFAVQIPVRGGDVIGLRVGNPPVFPDLIGGGASCAFVSEAGNTVRGSGSGIEAAPGADQAFAITYAAYRLNVTARLEHDADADGFGDETQDGCPGAAGVTGGCPAATPGGEAPAADKTPPAAKLRVRRQALKRGRVRVSITTSEDATVSVRATVAVPGSAKAHRLHRWTGVVKANRAKAMRLRLPRKAQRAVRRALARGKRVRVRVTVTLRDAAGNAGAAKGTVRLKR